MKPIRRLITAVLLFALSVPTALAADPVLVISGSGYYFLVQDSAGKPVLSPFADVVNLEGQLPPPPPPGSNLTQLVQRLTSQVGDPTTAYALAKVYELVREGVENGTINHSRAFEAVSAATDAVLSKQSATEAWAPWRSAVGDELARLHRDGKLSTKADYVRVLGEIESGLSNATSLPGILDRIDLDRLIQLIELIIRLISTFSATE